MLMDLISLKYNQKINQKTYKIFNMRLIFYIFLISQLLNFLGVFADKIKEDSSELNSVNWEKVQENKAKTFKKIT